MAVFALDQASCLLGVRTPYGPSLYFMAKELMMLTVHDQAMREEENEVIL